MPKVSDAHRQARRREILDAAAACFARDGFHRTSMQDIVRESGISAGLVYRYFSGKDDVIAAIVGEWHEQRAHLLTGTGLVSLPAYLDMLRAVGTAESVDDLRLGVQVWAEALRSPAIAELARGGVDRFRGLAVDTIRGMRREGSVPAGVDADALARVLIAIYQGLMLQTAWDGTTDNEGFVRTVAALVGPLTDTGPSS